MSVFIQIEQFLVPCWSIRDLFGVFFLWLFGIDWSVFGYNWPILLFGHFSAILDGFW